jgi:hypothetical protein
VRGTAVTALWLKTRFFVRVIFMRDLQCGSGQLSGFFALGIANDEAVTSIATHAIIASVVIQSFGCVPLCFAARSGNTAPGPDDQI